MAKTQQSFEGFDDECESSGKALMRGLLGRAMASAAAKMEESAGMAKPAKVGVTREATKGGVHCFQKSPLKRGEDM